MCEIAKKNLEITRQIFPAITSTIVNNDAFYYKIPGDADCIFLFNPFDELIMSGVVKNISESLRSHPRKITIIYVNPINKILFTGAGFKEVFYSRKMKYLEVAVMEKAGI